MGAVRINKYLASVGVAARRKVDTLIEEEKVTVNGKKAILGQKINPDADKIAVNGRLITPSNAFASEGKGGAERIYIVLNKPKGVVSTAIDTHNRKTVIDLVQVGKRLYPVGRLDVESEGLILLTNDGELTHHLMHPKFHVAKTYVVKFLGQVPENKISAIRSGVTLEGARTAPAKVRAVKAGSTNVLEIVLYEGKNRQIRKMAEKLHLHILQLKRVAIGSVQIEALESGKWRNLTDDEVSALKKEAGLL